MSEYIPKVPSVLSLVRELESKPAAVVAFGREYPCGHLIESHHHERAQLIYASEGVMRIDMPGKIWVVPPLRAIWVPPGMDHEIRATSALHLRTLFFRPHVRDGLPKECCVVEVQPLLRELILRLVMLTESPQPDGGAEHVIEVILDEICEGKILPMQMPLPTTARLLRVCRAILDNPADTRTSAEWGLSVGASSRTLERLFKCETGTTFSAWRQQARLLSALPRLAAREPIAAIALNLGYQSPSAFAAMFKRSLGFTPSEFCSGARDGH